MRQFPSPTEEEVSAARDGLPSQVVLHPLQLLSFMLIGCGLCGEFLIIPLAFLLRGGISFSLGGIHLRDRRGRRASRLRCTWRSLLCRLPIQILVGVGVVVATEAGVFSDTSRTEPAMVSAGLLMMSAGLLLLAWGLFSILRNPARGLVDRVAGTYLVPR